MFVAPVTVGDGAYTGAGTVVRNDVPPGTLAVSAGPQRNIEGWVRRKRPGSAAAQAAEAAEKAAGQVPAAEAEADTVTSVAGNPAIVPYDSLRTMGTSIPLRIGKGSTVSHDWTDNRKNLMLFSGRAHPELAEQVAKELDVHVTAQTAREFANGEIFVRFHESVRGCDAFVLQSAPTPVNDWLMEQLIMIDALKRGSAKRITAVMPFYPYARQDKKHRGREPISARLVADLLKTAAPTGS